MLGSNVWAAAVEFVSHFLEFVELRVKFNPKFTVTDTFVLTTFHFR